MSNKNKARDTRTRMSLSIMGHLQNAIEKGAWWGSEMQLDCDTDSDMLRVTINDVVIDIEISAFSKPAEPQSEDVLT